MSYRRKPRRSIGPSLSQQRPSDPRHLVGKCDRNDLERSPGEKLREPGILLRLLARTSQDGTCSNDQDATQVTIPCFEIGPSFCLPPVEFVVARAQPMRRSHGRSKNLRIRDARCDRGGPEKADPGDGLQSLALFIRAMLYTSPASAPLPPPPLTPHTALPPLLSAPPPSSLPPALPHNFLSTPLSSLPLALAPSPPPFCLLSRTWRRPFVFLLPPLLPTHSHPYYRSAKYPPITLSFSSFSPSAPPSPPSPLPHLRPPPPSLLPPTPTAFH